MHHQFQFMVVAENRAFKLDPPAKLNNLPPGISYFFPLSVEVDYRKFVHTMKTMKFQNICIPYNEESVANKG